MELISRDEVIKALQKWNCRDSVSLTINPYEVLRDIPTIEERKEGKWEKNGHGLKCCSVCRKRPLQVCYYDINYDGYMSKDILSKYCPHCGARMKGE